MGKSLFRRRILDLKAIEIVEYLNHKIIYFQWHRCLLSVLEVSVFIWPTYQINHSVFLFVENIKVVFFVFLWLHSRLIHQIEVVVKMHWSLGHGRRFLKIQVIRTFFFVCRWQK